MFLYENLPCIALHVILLKKKIKYVYKIRLKKMCGREGYHAMVDDVSSEKSLMVTAG